MKTCFKCDEVKPIDQFHKDKSKYDGYHSYCKLCRKKQAKDHWEFKNPKQENKCIDCNTNIDHMNVQRLRCDSCRDFVESKRKRPVKDKERKRAMAKIWRKNNPEKCKAYYIKYNKLRKDKTLSKS